MKITRTPPGSIGVPQPPPAGPAGTPAGNQQALHHDGLSARWPGGSPAGTRSGGAGRPRAALPTPGNGGDTGNLRGELEKLPFARDDAEQRRLQDEYIRQQGPVQAARAKLAAAAALVEPEPGLSGFGAFATSASRRRKRAELALLPHREGVPKPEAAWSVALKVQGGTKRFVSRSPAEQARLHTRSADRGLAAQRFVEAAQGRPVALGPLHLASPAWGSDAVAMLAGHEGAADAGALRAGRWAGPHPPQAQAHEPQPAAAAVPVAAVPWMDPGAMRQAVRAAMDLPRAAAAA